ncbi:hypothetical protein V2J09_017202 [Rumex salicifolius]
MGDDETRTNVVDQSSSKHEGDEGKNKKNEEEEYENKLELGPMYSIKDHLEKDKDDESLRKWKEQLLGNVNVDGVEENLEPEVKILSLTILLHDRPEMELPIPETGNPDSPWFTLKEGSPYILKFCFTVRNNIVSGLKYVNNVYKTGLKVDTTKEMIGTFSPQLESYTHQMPEETTPSGFFARGSYSAKTKFIDDDNKCYLAINYTFDIQKDWPSS